MQVHYAAFEPGENHAASNETILVSLLDEDGVATLRI